MLRESVSAVKSTDLGRRSAEHQGIAPKPSSVSRREKIYRYPDHSLSPAKCAPDAEKVPTTMEKPNLVTGAVHGLF